MFVTSPKNLPLCPDAWGHKEQLILDFNNHMETYSVTYIIFLIVQIQDHDIHITKLCKN